MKAFYLKGEDAPDLIKVYATKEEWNSILNRLEWTDRVGAGAPEELIRILEVLGV